MLSEVELQELRGMAFDRLLLLLWPGLGGKGRTLKCRSCGNIDYGAHRRFINARELCQGCYLKWWRNSRIPQQRDSASTLNAGAMRYSGDRMYLDALMAKRLGASLTSLKAWRNGTVLPWRRTLLRVAPQLETEFGVPASLWLEALDISQKSRGWEVAKVEYAQPVQQRLFPVSEDYAGDRFGYWLVVETLPASVWGHIHVRVRCLICSVTLERILSYLRTGRSSSCRQCSARLYRMRRAAGLRGARYDGRPGIQVRWVVPMRLSGKPAARFTTQIEAARYYDACMYERYGHTLFLNFPGEYDRSNDPVFAPVTAQPAR